MRKKVLASIMAASLVLSVFAGCGNKDENKATDVETGSEEKTEDFEADVLVVGGGFSGINAAIEAAELGAKVILFEQNAMLGGSANFAGGTLSGAGTKMQEEFDVEDTPEKFYEDIERLGKGKFIPELTKKHTEKSAEAVDWMDSLGVDFGDRSPKQPGSYEAFDTPREYRAENGKVYIDTLKPLLEDYIEDGKVLLLYETEVTDIIIEDEAVVGVVANDKANDKETTYRAKSTILATGGYGHNEEWVNRYNFKNAVTGAPAHANGSGYDFAEKAGAVFSNMDYLPPYPGGVRVEESGFRKTVGASTNQYPGAVWVSIEGERMIDEFDSTPGPIADVWANAPENIVYILFDESMKNSNDPILNVNNKEDENWERFDEELEKGDVVFKGETIEELAENAGIEVETLKATMETYNKNAANGEDTVFGRKSSLIEFKDGPFYAVKTVPNMLLTKGGPLMNTKAQTLNKDNEPIEGLFQCGELVGGANIGGAASIGGLAHTICVVWGKIAAESAVEHSLNN